MKLCQCQGVCDIRRSLAMRNNAMFVLSPRRRVSMLGDTATYFWEMPIKEQLKDFEALENAEGEAARFLQGCLIKLANAESRRAEENPCFAIIELWRDTNEFAFDAPASIRLMNQRATPTLHSERGNDVLRYFQQQVIARACACNVQVYIDAVLDMLYPILEWMEVHGTMPLEQPPPN